MSESGPVLVEPPVADAADDVVASVASGRHSPGSPAPARGDRPAVLRVGTVKSQARDALARLRDLAPDLWRRGKRRHRRRQAVGAAAVGLALIALLTPVTWRMGDPQSARPADSGPAIPSRVQAPWPRQAQATDAPAGPAALIVTNFQSGDIADNDEGRTVVVARDGRYRMVDGLDEDDAGTGRHLSPDGRLLAVAGPVENAARSRCPRT